MLLILLACAPTPAAPPALPSTPMPPLEAPPPRDYDADLADLEAQRQALAARWRAGDRDAIDEGRALLLQAFSQQIFPAWYGTEWEFYGTTQTPGQGSIACGYFVSTTLEHAGFQVERVKMAQQASERIIQTLVPEREIQRYSMADTDTVLADLDTDGLYLVGLDYHVGYLLKEGPRLDMCHSSVWAPGSVVCEPAASAQGMLSNYRVVGQLLGDDMMESWLEGRTLPTR